MPSLLPLVAGAALALAGPNAETEPATLPQPAVGAIPDDVLAAARDARHLPLPDRMEAVSRVLLGRPYVADPMGEGTGYDADPVARYDAFDCLTFTEEVLALSLAGDPAHAGPIRAALRYDDADIDYVSRRHFMELQWVPSVLRDGWLEDTTSDYGDVRHMEKVVDDQTWSGWGPRARFQHRDDQLPSGTMALDVLPLDRAIEVAESIRPGSVILTVREDRAGVPIWTTHVGFVVHTEDGVRLRHATKLGSGGTKEHSLRWYLEHIRSYRWKVAGITVLEPVELGPRLGADAGLDGPGLDPPHEPQR